MLTKLMFSKFPNPGTVRGYQHAEVIVETGCPLFGNDHLNNAEVKQLLMAGFTLSAHIDNVNPDGSYA